MRNRRPLECPACGHEQVGRRRSELRAETRLLRVRSREWVCSLCGYVWATPASTTEDDWAVV